jgi:type VI secretion system protein ImpF
MAKEREIGLAQSLMERLGEKEELPQTQTGSVRLLKEVIRRDLETLLNTRRMSYEVLDDFVESRGTVLDYGLEDLSALPTGPDGYLQEMRRAISRCVADFEPRLTGVVVSLKSSPAERREIRLHIEATLPLYPSVEVVSFDTVYDLTRETYSVGE